MQLPVGRDDGDVAPCVVALRLNSTLVITCYHPFILSLYTFCGVSDYILKENIILYYTFLSVGLQGHLPLQGSPERRA